MTAAARWTRSERLLVTAALGDGAEARDAWAELRPDFDVDALSGDWYRLAPLVGWNLERSGLAADDDPVVARLLGITRRTWVQSHRHLAALGDVCGLLADAGIPAVTLKGAALLRVAYPELGLRPMEDLDVLVPPEHEADAAAALVAAGHEPVHRARAGHAGSWRMTGGIELDLHVQPNPWLVQRAGGAGLRALHDGALAVDLPDGRRVRVADPADQLLVVLVHGVRPGGGRLRWVADASWLVRTGGVDWSRFVDQAVRFDVTGLVARAVADLDDLRGPVVPAGVAEEVRRRRPSTIDRLVLAALDDDRFPDVGRSIVYRLRTLPPGSRLRALPAVTAEKLGSGSLPTTALVLARRVPGYRRRAAGGRRNRPAAGADASEADAVDAVDGRPPSVRVAVTGSESAVGRRLTSAFEERGHDVVRVDLVHGVDLRDPRRVGGIVAGCHAVVHLASVPWDARWRSALAANVWGTGLLLRAARRAGVGRVVYLSTLQVTGAFMGRRPPVRLPFDEDHPCRPETAYAVSKRWAERLCARATRRDPALSAVSVRPPAIWEADRYERDRARWEADETRQWRPFWEYGAFIDVDDLVDLLVRAVEADLAPGHEVLTVSGPDSASQWPTWHLVQHLHPTVPWRSGHDRAAVQAEPFHPLVDSTKAERLLAWRPTRPFHTTP